MRNVKVVFMLLFVIGITWLIEKVDEVIENGLA